MLNNTILLLIKLKMIKDDGDGVQHHQHEDDDDVDGVQHHQHEDDDDGDGEVSAGGQSVSWNLRSHPQAVIETSLIELAPDQTNTPLTFALSLFVCLFVCSLLERYQNNASFPVALFLFVCLFVGLLINDQR